MSLHEVAGNPRGFLDGSIEATWYGCLKDILKEGRLAPVFQPIIDLQAGSIVGYEGLIRGPSDGPLHSPVDLFRVAGENGLTVELEILCCQTLLGRFAALSLPGQLFLNISPPALPHIARDARVLVHDLHKLGLSPGKVVFELTEHAPHDGERFHELLASYRDAGFQLALDDLGDGHSSLRRWSEFKPEYVKVDLHFVQGVHLDPLKQQFLRSIRDIARESGALVVAEGIEHQEELEYLAAIGIRGGQGFYIAMPDPRPLVELPESLLLDLADYREARKPIWSPPAGGVVNAGTLLRNVPHAAPGMTNDGVCELFAAHPELQSIPVVDRGTPVGMILRDDLIGRFARPYQRELYGRRSCTLFMDSNPPMADESTSLQQLSHMLIEADRSRLISDFIITSQGRYLGIGTSYDLLRELTEVQIMAARHANPLTQLPGNVPVNLHIEHLLASETPFCACYADLDNFKPFNDVYGYAKGDEIIQMTGRLLSSYARSQDFVGHIGGDDFLILWCSQDWEARCQALLKAFGSMMSAYLSDNGLINDDSDGGYCARDRAGKQRFFAWPSISLGIVKAQPLQYESYHQIAAAAAEAKALAKNISGNSLHIERRHSHRPHPGGAGGADVHQLSA